MPSVPRLDSPIPDPSDGDWTAANGRRWTLTHYDDILTVNKERSTHWSTRSSVVKAWREAFAWLALTSKLPTNGSVGPCHIDAVPLTARRSGRQDVGACLPVVKAAIDGLVDAGVWPDDTPDYVLSIRFWPQQKSSDQGVRIVISEEVRRMT
jgi:crossover junction endodeoxyribonuclease RusA